MFKPELLSPAGTLKNMRYAFAYGADAVYAGQPRYSLRVRNNEFNHENLQIGINEAHALGKKFYVVCNIQPHNSKLKTFIRDMKPVVDMGPDALIMSDPGLIMMVREHFPQMPIHLSVQANAVNWATVKFWQQQGVERVILSRELSLEEIEDIREHAPEMELEVFVHGALCMAYSGRCLLSGYINKRDPNQGTCTNSCRWKYDTHEAKENEVGDIVAVQPEIYTPEKVAPTLGEGQPTDQVVLLQEQGRPGEYMPAFEDEHGTYIMNSKDLRAIEHVERLTQMGVHSLKIEGRTKSFYYCARTAQIYKQAIDDAVAGRPFDQNLKGTLESLAHRGYTEGFLRRHNHSEYQNYDYGYSVSTHQQFVGEITGRHAETGLVEVTVKNKFLLGDSMELMTPKGNITFTLEQMQNRKGEAIDDAKGSGHIVYIPLPSDIELEFALLMRNLPEDADTRNPHQAKSA
ncbi:MULTISPECIES: tRNA 5-hydroxyuridine modification protein YegQ [unclassified Motilimonas]|uniref:prephenate-dependent tRNA uridine(34) hydroxylase TrhP n=1 Tax=Motilimonas TaxID=1914248 RepID=UPI001E5D9C77|nr:MULTISPECIES: tRNA 5-hydroxyuridine modification protein YegQ [unclassified Motilimonas]MCE0555898.1 tRNA 5-hydroxyuridine modification protein YegQ [Motilimonas sp. E26]MDO6527795.1 tRNA 5-hydroxyuridine modification protein YegQ [Motilimonas sp. 1_MG-2023]